MKLMSIKKNYLRLALIVLVSAVAGWAVIPAAYGDQPRMHKALNYLKAARSQLSRSTHDKGGHRLKAMALVDQAILEVQAGIAFDRTHGPDR